MKKLLTSLLCVMMVVCFMPAMAWADGTTLPSATEGTITLTENVTLSDGYTVDENTTVEIDLAGYTLNLGQGTLLNKGTLTIKDSSTDETGKIVSSGTNGNVHGPDIKGTITNEGTLNVLGGTIDALGNQTPALANKENGKVYLTKGKLIRSNEDSTNTTESGGSNSCYAIMNRGHMEIYEGVEVVQNGHFSSLVQNGWYDGSKNTDKVDAVMIINGGTFTGGINTIKNDDYGILTINEGTFKNTTQASLLNWNVTTINGGEFESGDYAILNGYANDTCDKGQLTITDGTFSSGETTIEKMNGGNIGQVIIQGGTFENTEDGRTLPETLDKGGSILVTGGTFSSDDATSYLPSGMQASEDDGKYVIETKEDVEAQIGTAVYETLSDAVKAAGNGDTIKLLKNVESAGKIILPAGVTLDGNGKSISLTNKIDQGAFIETSSDNVTIQNVIINTNGNAKHGIQYYKAENGTVEKVTVNGGSYTSIIVNGSKVEISDSVLNPDKGAYANIEYAMGTNVKTIPKITVTNVTGSSGKPLVYADEATITGVKTEATLSDDAAAVAEINKTYLDGAKLTYIKGNEVVSPGTVTYTITFNANGGTVTPTSAVTNEEGLLSDLPTPKRSGSYSFKGWYTAASSGTQVTESTKFNANTTIYAQWEYTGVIYVPTTPTVQKPAIEADSNATVTLDSTGTTATITVADGYELADVTVNGVSKGAVTTLTGLKTGDKVVVTTKKTEEPPVVDDSARIKAGVQATTLKIYSKSLNTKGSGKGWIQVRWVKSKGFKVDGYELYRGKTKSTMKRYDTTTKTTYTNKNYLKKGNRYYYKVRGYRMINGEKVYTQWSKTIYRLAK